MTESKLKTRQKCKRKSTTSRMLRNKVQVSTLLKWLTLPLEIQTNTDSTKQAINKYGVDQLAGPCGTRLFTPLC